MAKRNLEKMIEVGKQIGEQYKLDLYTDDMQAIHEAAKGSEFEVMRLTFYSALAIGYEKGFLKGLSTELCQPKRKTKTK